MSTTRREWDTGQLLELEAAEQQLSDLPPCLHELFDAARADKPSEEMVDRLVGTVTVAASATLLSRTIAAFGSRTPTLVGLKGLLLVSGLVGVILPVVLTVGGSRVHGGMGRPELVHSSGPNDGATPVSSHGLESPDPPIGLPTDGFSSETRREPAVRATRLPPQGGALASKPSQPPTTFGGARPTTTHRGMVIGSPPLPSASEAKPASQRDYITMARLALNGGRSAEAIRVLDEYDRAFAWKTFAPEALQLRCRANIKLGDRAAAERAAETLRRDFPHTPQGKEAQSSLDCSVD